MWAPFWANTTHIPYHARYRLGVITQKDIKHNVGSIWTMQGFWSHSLVCQLFAHAWQMILQFPCQFDVVLNTSTFTKMNILEPTHEVDHSCLVSFRNILQSLPWWPGICVCNNVSTRSSLTILRISHFAGISSKEPIPWYALLSIVANKTYDVVTQLSSSKHGCSSKPFSFSDPPTSLLSNTAL